GAPRGEEHHGPSGTSSAPRCGLLHRQTPVVQAALWRRLAVEAGFGPPLMGALRDPEAAIARRRYVIGRVAIYGVLVIFALIYAFPAYLVISGAFRTGAD